MKFKKCIHVVAFDDYKPLMCEITLPNLRAYADKIGADFNLIREKRFDGYPPNFERLQVWWAGNDYDINFNIDADTLMHKDAEDPSEWFPHDHFGSLWAMDADFYFDMRDIYFQRDGRNLSVSDNFTVSTRFTHDAWEPPAKEITYDLMVKKCFKDPRQVSEYWISRNIARYGIKHMGALKDHSKQFGLMATNKGYTDIEAAHVMRDKLIEWGMSVMQ